MAVIDYAQFSFCRRRFLSRELTLQPSRCQLPVAVGVNLLLASGQHILRRDIADGTVQSDAVVMLDMAVQEAPGIVQRKRCSRSNTLAL